jgi:hypothetical protein
MAVTREELVARARELAPIVRERALLGLEVVDPVF